MDFSRIELLVRLLCDIHNSGKDVVLVSSGAIAAGKYAIGYGMDRSINRHELTLPQKQACAAIGQGRLMNIYEKFFTEYNSLPAQVLMTKDTVLNDTNRMNATNTFKALLDMGVIPIVNENDTIATHEIEIGDNDTLSAMVASMVEADLLILLSDIEGLYTDDPNKNPDAKFIAEVPEITLTLQGLLPSPVRIWSFAPARILQFYPGSLRVKKSEPHLLPLRMIHSTFLLL